jgi:flagellin
VPEKQCGQERKSKKLNNAGTNPEGIVAIDFNGDDKLDLAVTAESDNSVNVLLGNGDGTFRGRSTYNLGVTSYDIQAADMNNDDAIDLVTGNYVDNSVSVLTANPAQITLMPLLNLRTQDSALDEMEVIDDALSRVSAELGNIGAAQSRMETALKNLQVGRENYISAASQIKDVDVAQESANLVRAQILQQAGAAVLAQANQAPALALVLLRGGIEPIAKK